jgi:phosphoglycolate phosphatase-like HAD superfamily hydrolase
VQTLRYYRTAERPDIKLWLTDSNGTLVDLSTGYTFAFKLGNPGAAADFTKTTGITGAAGAGVDPSGTPNITHTFTAAELDGVTAGAYLWQIRATTGGLDRYFQGPFHLHDVIT